MKKFDFAVLMTGIAALVLTIVMFVTTLFVFSFDAKREAGKDLKWGWSKVVSYYDKND